MRLGKFLVIVGITTGNIIQFDYDPGQEFEIVRRKGLKLFSVDRPLGSIENQQIIQSNLRPRRNLNIADYSSEPENKTEVNDDEPDPANSLMRSVGGPGKVEMEGRAYAKPLNMIESMIDYILTTAYSNQNVQDILNYGCWCQVDK